MRLLVFILVALTLETSSANTCGHFFLFNNKKTSEFETHDEKPKFFSVRNYSSLRRSELSRFLLEIRNLTQFSEKIGEINSHIPERTMLVDRSPIPSEAYFVANRLVPLIESFLKQHNVNYKMETLENPADPRIKRVRFNILPQGKNPLNELSTILASRRSDSIRLVIDPMELFLGLSHYNQSQGEVFSLSPYSKGYRLSLHSVLHSQRAGFKADFNREKDLAEILDLRLKEDRAGERFQSDLSREFRSNQ